MWAILAGAAVVILFVVFVLAGGGDDGGGDSTTTSSTSANGKTVGALEEAAAQGSRKVTKASLEAVDGSDAIGVAIFGRVKNSLALQVAAEGLEPTGKGESYTIWLAASPEKMLPLASTKKSARTVASPPRSKRRSKSSPTSPTKPSPRSRSPRPTTRS